MRVTGKGLSLLSTPIMHQSDRKGFQETLDVIHMRVTSTGRAECPLKEIARVKEHARGMSMVWEVGLWMTHNSDDGH